MNHWVTHRSKLSVIFFCETLPLHRVAPPIPHNTTNTAELLRPFNCIPLFANANKTINKHANVGLRPTSTPASELFTHIKANKCMIIQRSFDNVNPTQSVHDTLPCIPNYSFFLTFTMDDVAASPAIF